MAKTTAPFEGQEELADLIARVKQAQDRYATYSQEQVDTIFRAAAIAANDERIALAVMAVEETGMGIVEDKVIKYHFAAEYIFHSTRMRRPAGPSRSTRRSASPDFRARAHRRYHPHHQPHQHGDLRVPYRPQDPQCHHQPHPRAKQCTVEAARVIRDAAVKAGARKDHRLISEPTMEKTQYLMHHP